MCVFVCVCVCVCVCVQCVIKCYLLSVRLYRADNPKVHSHLNVEKINYQPRKSTQSRHELSMNETQLGSRISTVHVQLILNQC